ncbi:MAG: alanine racemase [Balneolaceae bacterium]
MESIDLRYQPSVIELSQKALQNNISYLKKGVGKGVRLSSVIKGNAYGHGISTFLPMAERCGIDHFSVFSADEAWRAMQARTSDASDVMIMGMIADEAIEWAVEQGVSFYLFEMGRLESAVAAAIKTGMRARVHIQLETGMNRIGFEEEELDQLLASLERNHEWIAVEGVCTHFAGAESIANHVRIEEQKRKFSRMVFRFRSGLFDPFLLHAASSAATFAYPDTRYDMVRIGIAQYGYWPSREVYMLMRKNDYDFTENPLERVIRWRSKVMSVKEVGEGEFVGYGTIYLTNRPETIATVPVGYTHGFGRNLTNIGHVLVRGERVRVVGQVNMNMLTIDVTDVPQVQRGDEVVLIGKQGEQEISVASFGELTNNLNYEVLTRLPSELPRLVFGGDS